MTIAQSLLPEFDQEIASTRKLLGRVPDDKLGWRPHEKSYTLGELASHIANLLTWTGHTIEGDAFEMSSDSPPPSPPKAGSGQELVKLLDSNAADARSHIARADDETLMGTWSLVVDGTPLFTMPRVAVLRTFVMNHLIHHRGQLTVYLRQNGVALPSIYGPSADER